MKKGMLLILSLTLLTGCSLSFETSSQYNPFSSSSKEDSSATSLSSNETQEGDSSQQLSGDSSEYSVSSGNYEDSSETVISQSSSNSDSHFSSESTNVSSTSNSTSSTVSSSLSVEETPVGYTINLDYNYSSQVSGKYETGNYGITSIGGFKYEYYRTYSSSNDLVKLLSSSVDGAIGGSIGNYAEIVDIDEISITYATESDAKLMLGSTHVFDETISLPASSNEYLTKTFNLTSKDVNYFMVESGSSDVDIKSISIIYTGEGNTRQTTYLSSGEGKYRLNPVTTSTKIAGVSYVDIPVEIAVNNSSYTVTKNKRYTYYDYDSVESNPSFASLAAWTDPIDVANYFVAFGEAPANYVSKSQYNSASEIFGSDTRCASSYTRTSGYANYVPYATGDGGVPHYTECDIALSDDYSGSNRGVGRVIVFTDGFTGKDYDSSPVAVYTDDHYTTFQEFYNNGTFSHRYNAIYSNEHSLRTNYEYGYPTTLN